MITSLLRGTWSSICFCFFFLRNPYWLYIDFCSSKDFTPDIFPQEKWTFTYDVYNWQPLFLNVTELKTRLNHYKENQVFIRHSYTFNALNILRSSLGTWPFLHKAIKIKCQTVIEYMHKRLLKSNDTTRNYQFWHSYNNIFHY